MKKILLFGFLSICFIFLFSGFGKAKYPGGAPAGFTGSPGDGQDCSVIDCHNATSVPVTGWITSNVPVAGYTPGVTYQITVTVTGTNGENKGFEVSPQMTDGTLVGTIAAGVGSKLTGSGKYITHNAAMTTTNAVWVFNWTAPNTGVGPVTFYGAFVSSFPNVFHSSTVIPQNTTGIEEAYDRVYFKVFPNPMKEKLSVSYELKQQGHVQLSLYDLIGTKVATLLDEDQNSGKSLHAFDLAGIVKSGIYLIKLTDQNATLAMQKLIVN